MKRPSIEVLEPRAFAEYPDLPAVIDRIEELAAQAELLTGAARKIKLAEAQRLADAYEAHCTEGGNPVNQFRKML